MYIVRNVNIIHRANELAYILIRRYSHMRANSCLSKGRSVAFASAILEQLEISSFKRGDRGSREAKQIQNANLLSSPWPLSPCPRLSATVFIAWVEPLEPSARQCYPSGRNSYCFPAISRAGALS